MRHVPQRLRLIVCICVFLLLFKQAVLLGQESRRPTLEELYELADHVSTLPPRQFDILIFVEFDLEPLSEADLRKAVKSVLSRTYKARSRIVSGEELAKEVEREVQRLLLEQEHPRRIKERWRRSGADYRVDQYGTFTGFESINAIISAEEWEKSFIYTVNAAEYAGEPCTGRLDWGQKILSIYGKRHGRVREARDPWVAGTVGMQIALALRAAFEIVQSENGGALSSPSTTRLEELVAGTHAAMDIQVEDHPGSKARWFSLRVRSTSVNMKFRTSATAIAPVSDVEIYDSLQSIAYRLRVLELSPSGEPSRWSEEKIHPRSGELRKITFTLLSKNLSPVFAEEPFSLSQPVNWSVFDYRPESVVVLDKDGTPFQNVVSVPAAQSSDKMPGALASHRWRFILPHVIAILTLIYVWYVKRSRAAKN